MGDSGDWASHPIIDSVRAIGPEVAARSQEIESLRQLPDDLVEKLTSIGVFQMYLSRAAGGAEVHPLTAFTVCEELARRDGSVGWCTQVANATLGFLAWLDPDAVDEMVDITDGPLHIAGSARPLGTATTAEGGFRVNGHWNFSSGVRHANWFLATSFVQRPSGRTASRGMLLPVGDGEIVANWDVMGMKGTGSDDFVLDDVFVPERRVAGGHWISGRAERLYDPRLLMVTTWAPTAGVAVGLAQGAVDALVALGSTGSTGSPEPLREREPVQAAVAEAEAITSAARAFVIESIEAAWQALDVGGPTLDRAVARAQLAITHAMNEAVRVVDIAFHAAGTNAISSEHRLERFLRDAHTAVQHAAGQPVHKRMAGRVLLGLTPGALDPTRVGPSTPR